MPQIDEPTTPAPKAAPEVRKAKVPAAAKLPESIYSFTIDTAKGRILSVESVDVGGTRRPLTAEEKIELGKSPGAMPIRRLVERAFEAGIECVLGDSAGTDSPESKEDGELSAILLRTLIEGSKARELVKDDALDRTLFDTLIGQAARKPAVTS